MKGCFMKKPVDDITRATIMNYALELVRMNPKYSLAEAVNQVQKALAEIK